MSKNESLHQAKVAKNDEFFTLYEDVERCLNDIIEYDHDVFRDKVVLCPCDDPEWSSFTKYFVANFERLGLKKLISTSYAHGVANEQISLFEKDSEFFDAEKHENHGRIFVLDRKKLKNKNLNRLIPTDLKWKYLEGDGDFRSEEVTRLRDESDIIVTNPPFSLFIDIIAWIMEKPSLKFALIGNKNAITYKNVFPLIKDNKMWLGTAIPQAFKTPSGEKTKKVAGLCRWFTNLDFYKRHEWINYMTMEDNLRFNAKLKKKFLKDYGKLEYPHYDNYDAIEVSFCDAIPSDYTETKKVTPKELQKLVDQGFDIKMLATPDNIRILNPVMGVPITYLDKHNPEQYEIVAFRKGSDGKDLVFTRERVQPYFRILIRKHAVTRS